MNADKPRKKNLKNNICVNLCLSAVSIVAVLTLKYKGLELQIGYYLELLLERIVIVELKLVEFIEPIHEAQLMTYLRLTGLWLGLLLNFNIPVLRQGIKRIVLG